MSLLSSIAGLIGLAVGGPIGAALGSGIGTLASGGDIGDALKAGVMGYGIGSIPGVSGIAAQGAQAMGMQGLAGQFATQAAKPTLLSGLFGGGGAGAAGAAGAANAAAGAGAAGAAGGAGGLLSGSGIMGFAQQNPMIMAALLQAAEPSDDMLSPLQKRQLATGERLPDYKGTAAPDYRYMPRQNMAIGGLVEGPGTGTSDSIPAKIFQRGGPVQEAALSDGEFVMTENAVRGMGDGDRRAGAARMYEMMNRLERRA